MTYRLLQECVGFRFDLSDGITEFTENRWVDSGTAAHCLAGASRRLISDLRLKSVDFLLEVREHLSAEKEKIIRMERPWPSYAKLWTVRVISLLAEITRLMSCTRATSAGIFETAPLVPCISTVWMNRWRTGSYLRLAGDLLLASTGKGQSFDAPQKLGHLLVDAVQRYANLILTFENHAKLAIVFRLVLKRSDVLPLHGFEGDLRSAAR